MYIDYIAILRHPYTLWYSMAKKKASPLTLSKCRHFSFLSALSLMVLALTSCHLPSFLHLLLWSLLPLPLSPFFAPLPPFPGPISLLILLLLVWRFRLLFSRFYLFMSNLTLINVFIASITRIQLCAGHLHPFPSLFNSIITSFSLSPNSLCPFFRFPFFMAPFGIEFWAEFSLPLIVFN